MGLKLSSTILIYGTWTNKPEESWRTSNTTAIAPLRISVKVELISKAKQSFQQSYKRMIRI